MNRVSIHVMRQTAVICRALFVVLALTSIATASELPDPTRPIGGRSAPPPPKPAAAPKPVAIPDVLQSTLISPQRQLAIINGRVVGIGDRVGEAVVAEIRSNEVLLRGVERDTRLRLIPRDEPPAVTRRDSPE
jgi:MSHA biogenesis protein MshK